MNDEVVPQHTLSPYPGLRPFDTDEAEIFFGREEQTDQILNRLSRTRFLAIVGPSGCGKSSLVRAGMIVALQSGLMSAAGSRWRIAQMRPGERPVWRLAQALAEPAALDLEGKGGATALAFADATLRRGPLGLIELLQERWLPGDTSLLLLIDQFEEIFRYRREQSAAEADAFVALLLATAAQREFPVYVVLTMRSDFLGECQLFRGLPEAINEGQYLTPRMTREQIRSAIIGPARIVGADVDADLATQLLNEVGSDPDQLPLLQHALMRMWQHMQERTDPAEGRRSLSLADYAAVGSIANALSSHANQVYKGLADSQRQIAEVMFRRLTHRSTGKRDTRRPALLGDVAGVAGTTATDVMSVVEEFRRTERSFVTPPAGVPLSAETTLDIGHESLIRQWDRLNHWVDAETKSADTYFRLKDSAMRELQGRAALWRSPDLDDGLKWQKEESPNEGWARRYGTPEEFERAMIFLERSAQQQRAGQEAAAQAQREREELERRSREEREQRLLVQAWAARKLRWLLAAMSVFAVIAVLFAYSALKSEQRAEVERHRAEAQTRIAEERSKMALARQLTTQATAALEHEGEGPLQAILLAMHSLRAAWTPEAYAMLVRNIDLLPGAKPATIAAHHSAVQLLEFSGDGKWLVSENRDEILVWDWPARKILKRLPRQAQPRYAARFSRDNRRLALARGRDTEIYDMATIHDAATWQPLAKLPYGTFARSLAFSPDGRQLVIASYHAADALVVDTATWKESGRIAGDKVNGIYAVAFSPDGKWLAASDLERVRIWEMKTRRVLGEVQLETRAESLEFTPDGRLLKTAGRSAECRFFYPVTGDGGGLKFESDTVLDALCFASIGNSPFSPDGHYFAVMGVDESAGVVDVDDRREVTRVMQGVSAAAFAPDGRTLITGETAGALGQWDFLTKESLRLPGVNSTMALAFSPNGRWLATVGEDRLVKIFETEGWQLVTTKPLGELSEGSNAWFSDDSNWLVLQDDSAVRVMATADWKDRLNDHFLGDSLSAGFSVDGRWLCIIAEHDFHVVNVATWRKVGPMHHDGFVAEVLASPDGNRFATRTDATFIRGLGLLTASITTVWDAASGSELGWLWNKEKDVERYGDRRAPDATGRWTKAESAGDAALAREANRWRVALSTDPQPKTFRAAWLREKTAGGDELSDVNIERARNAKGSPLRDEQFSPDEQWLATAGNDETVRLWRVSPAGLIAEACKRVSRELSAEEWQGFAGEEPYKPICAHGADAPAKQSGVR